MPPKPTENVHPAYEPIDHIETEGSRSVVLGAAALVISAVTVAYYLVTNDRNI